MEHSKNSFAETAVTGSTVLELKRAKAAKEINRFVNELRELT